MILPTIAFLGFTGKFSTRFGDRMRRLLLVMMIAAATIGKLPLGNTAWKYVL
jgi:hypothetical protein